ncbi:hypothetical protein CMI40_01460 [Candidatus Pacearchaeota archaeon]|jgi:Zn-dependent protease|nr:hypothetical protein [Candidatus Pacearchaeota archaeon]|tara:strand:+ start:10722 stop:11348 length:627 start_codon:yes stop_codon:yes gene_type:complete
MLNKKEIISILIVTLVLAFTISLIETWNIFLYSLISIFLIIIINIIAKKVASYYLDSEIEIKLWEIKRYGFKPHKYFKNPFQAGIFLPIIFIVFSLGYLKWMASLVFDVKPKTYRAAKRHGLYSFSEITEDHMGFIAAVGIFANLFFAIIGYLIGFSEFGQLNIYFAFFNMLPISDLDGNKIFFGSLPLWSFLATLVLIGLGYIFLLV